MQISKASLFGSKAKKTLLAIAACGAVSTAFADHNFTVCYHNQTPTPIYYINDGISHKWKTRGELIGSGQVDGNSSKCFARISDETMFSTDYITFTLGKEDGNNTYTRWVGIVVPAFAKPYVIAQSATATKGGIMLDNTKDGKDNYQLHLFVEPDGTLVFSGSSDFKDTSSYLEPRFFK